MPTRFSVALSSLLVLLLLGVATGQPYKVGLAIGPGTVVELPQSQTTAGQTVKRGVPTLVFFAKMLECSICEPLGDIAITWLEKYPNVQVIAVSFSSVKDAVVAWGEQYGVPIVFDSDMAFMKAFDTNLVFAYLLDEQGVVHDKVRPVYFQQWIALDRQLERANRGDWQAVDENAVALPPVGSVARGTPGVPLQTGAPALVLVGDGYCSYCRELLSEGLQKDLNDLAAAVPDLRIYLLEPSKESIASGFNGTPKHAYGAREVLEEFVGLFGERAAGEEVMTYLRTGELTYALPTPVWPDTGWPQNTTVIRYAVDGPDDPVRAWGYVEKSMPGMLVFDGEGRFLGPALGFTGNSSKGLASTVKRLVTR